MAKHTEAKRPVPHEMLKCMEAQGMDAAEQDKAIAEFQRTGYWQGGVAWGEKQAETTED